MNNIINLIKLHYSSVVALKKTALVVMALAFVVSISNVDGSMLPFGAALIIMILNYNTLAYEDNSKSNFLIYSLPVKPQEYVLSKYLYGGMNLIIAIIFGDVLYSVLNMMNIISSKDVSIGVLNITIIIVGIIVTDILVPIAMAVGFNKARIILVFLAITPMCMSGFIASVVSKMSITINISAINNISLGMMEAAVAVIGIVLSVASYFITIKLYAKRDIN